MKWQNLENPEMQLSNQHNTDDFFNSTTDFQRSTFNDTSFILSRERILTICLAGTFLIFALIFRLFNFQIVQGAEFAEIANRNRERTLITPSRRGVIYDRNNIVLASNNPNFQLVLSPIFNFTDDDRRNEIIDLLNNELGSEISDLVQSIDEHMNTEIILKDNIEHNQAMHLMQLMSEVPEVNIEQISFRQYITDQIPSLSHIIGYTGKMSDQDIRENPDYRRIDLIGKTGIESIYERELRGIPGRQQVEVNARGQIQRIIEANEATDGENIQLTIDSRLQAYSEEVVQRHLSRIGAHRASVVIMNPNNGEVLTLLSWPAYDANKFIGGISQSDYAELIEDEHNPLFHRSISGEFPSGSTIKTLYGAAALSEGIVTPNTSFPSTGGLNLGPWFFPDWRPGGHGITNIYHAIADSVNTYFYIIGGGHNTFDGLGVDKLMEYAKLFGLSSRTGIDQSQERAGFLPSREWKERVKGETWYIGDTYNVSIGQGDILVTPLQITRATASLVNGGILVSPHLLKSKEDLIEEQIIDSGIANVIKTAMRQTVTNGSARSLQSLTLPAGGKTGTAQWSSNRRNHSWFTGFAPYQNPEITITVLVEEDGNHGSAVSITREITQFWIDEIRENSTIQ